jgi:outer membrane protein OmpA-like peptidoglycan-associated protein
LKIAKIEIKKQIPFPSLSFPGKKSDLTYGIKSGLDSLATLMQQNPEIQVELASHTDSKGAAADNLKLSMARSDEMAFYLISKGISANRIVSLGYGESRLLNNCRDGILCLEEDHRVNNRTEVRVVDLLK